MKNTIESLLEHIKGSRSRKTYTTYRDALKTFVEVVGDNAPLTRETYIKFLKKTTGMNPSTQALCRSAIKRLYRFAADSSSEIQTSFFHQVDMDYALKPSRTIVLFNREGIEKIIEYALTMRNNVEDLRNRAFVLLLADTGLRVSEACNLLVGDIDLLEQKFVVMGKGDKPAVVHLSNRTAEAIKDYWRVIEVAKSMPLFRRHDKKSGGMTLPVTPGGMWYVVKRIAVLAGVDPHSIRVHDFRHYFVTVVYHAKGIKAAQTLARHESIKTTDRYTHLVEDQGEMYNEIFNK